MDVNFKKILSQLEAIHKDLPEKRFGEVLQIAIDQEKGKENVNLLDRSSKDILKCLEKYHAQEKSKRGVSN